MPSAGAANRAAIPQLSPGTSIGNWFRPDGGAETDRRVASFTIEPHEIEWIRSASNEVSKFGLSTTTRDNPRRCYRTSTSSGYSSHSPPLSAGSCSLYASALTSKDPLYGGLAVIHESETIPWSVWPPIVYHHENRNYEGIYVCRTCGCAYNYSLLPPTAFGLPPSSVIDDDNVIMSPDDISRVYPRNTSRNNNNVYEYICPFWSFNGNPSTSHVTGNAPTRSNPINSEFYVNPHRLYERDTMRSASLLKSKTTKCKEDGLTERSDLETRGPYIRKYLHGKPIENGCAKLSFGLEGVPEGCQRALASNESKYSTQLECSSDVGSSCEDTVVSVNDLNRRLAAAAGSEDLDFTLDVARAERLGRAIARAKRKRQWCRALTVLLGLAFFMLSVIVVSLSVTRGRKMFGSM